MFGIGDRVVYPMHGAGIIEAIEEREILGVIHQYYVMHIPIGNMQVFIPMHNIVQLGIRSVIALSQVPKVLKILEHESEIPPLAWNKRYRENLNRIKTGDIFSVAEVVRSLAKRARDKGLSTGEKRLFENACHILLSELVLADEMRADEIRDRIKLMLA